MSASRVKKWADESDDEETVGTITETFEDGIKTITEIKTNAKGQKVKVYITHTLSYSFKNTIIYQHRGY